MDNRRAIVSPRRPFSGSVHERRRSGYIAKDLVSSGLTKGTHMNLDVGPAQSNRAIFLAALEVPDERRRQALLKSACAGDAERLQAIQRLLAAHHAGAANPVDQAVEQLGPAQTHGPDADASVEFDISNHPTIDRYKLLEQIGEGGMGTVFMAQQTEPIRRKVALKLIKAGMDSREVISRFQAERQALALMDHPNIARVLDAGTTAEGRPYFVMELVRGIPITDYCDGECLSIDDRLRLLIDVCRAVQHAHQKGIIHRDLKPSNVMITLHDGTPVVKVIDFGVAKALNQELTQRTLFTQFAQMVGTPLYMSPEQAEMSGLDIDTRSDVYSLGVLLYELLTGTTPFDKARLSQAGFDGMRRIIREEEPSRPSHKLSTLEAHLLSTVSSRRKSDARQLSLSMRRELDWITMKALEKDRNRRYESASALAADVQRYLDGDHVLAHPPSPAYRIRKTAARHRGPLVAGLLILTVLVGGTAASLWQAVRASRAQRLADVRSQQARNQQQFAEQQTLLARREHDRAGRANERAKTLLYVSDMKLASDAIANDDLPRAAELLERHIPDGGEQDLRGFEWHYFHKRVAGPARITLDQDDWVPDVACSPDGRRLAVTATQGTIRIYDTQAWQVRQTLITEADWVNGLAWSHDGRLLAAACADGTLRLWNASTGEQQIEIPAHDGQAKDVVFSRDGRTVYSCGDDDLACAWDVDGGAQRLTLRSHGREVEQIALSADEKTLATASSDGSFAIWDAAAAERLHAFPQKGTRVVCVAISPDSQRVAAGDIHGGIYLADRRTGVSRRLAKQLDGIEDLVFVPGEKWLATVDRGGAVQLHPLAASPGKAAAAKPAPDRSPRWIAHDGRGMSIAVSPDGNRIISGGRDGLVQVWQPDLEASRWSPAKLPINDVATIAPNRLYAVGQKIYQWDLDRRQLDASFGQADSPWLITACSRDGRHLAAARRGQLALFDLASHSVQHAWALDERVDPYRLAVSADGRLVALADWTEREAVLVFDLDRPQRPRSLAALQCEALAFSPSGNRIAAGHQDDLRVYDLQTGGQPMILSGHSNTLSGVAFSPDGTRLATVSHDRLLKIWDAATGEQIFSVVADRGQVRSVDFSPDGRTIATAGRHGLVKLWHTATGQPLGTVASEGKWINKACFSAEGHQLAVQRYDDTIIVYDASPPPTPPTAADAAAD